MDPLPVSELARTGTTTLELIESRKHAGQNEPGSLRKSAVPEAGRRPWSARGHLYFATSHGRSAHLHKPRAAGTSYWARMTTERCEQDLLRSRLRAAAEGRDSLSHYGCRVEACLLYTSPSPRDG